MTSILDFFSVIRWQDLVDIGVTSYILYRLYVLFQGTNTLRVFLGLVSLWFLQKVVASIGLVLISWALQAITAAAAIIIIVVFRNEIRSALLVRNLRAFLWGNPREGRPTPVQVFTDAVYQMSRQRIGALIVFKGKEDLDEVVHGGIPWNGTVSQEMLMSIFWPKNPVHDGAVLVDGDQILEVGVFLPLTQRHDLPTFYGTRHRAAAGVVELSDALAVAVSEERGRVTVAKDHWIRPVPQPEEFAQILRDHLGLSAAADSEARKRTRIKHAVAAAASVLVMAGIWFGFTQNRDTIISMSVPIRFLNRAPTFEILDTSTNEVRLQMNGSSALLQNIRPDQVEVRVDLAKAVEGRNNFPITKENVKLPPGVFLTEVSPPAVAVTVDVPVTREIPVQVDWVGKLSDTVVLASARVNPETVQVTGSRTILERIQTLYTLPVRLDDLKRSGTLTAQILIQPASLKLAPNQSDRVSVEYVLAPRMAQP